MMNDTYKIKIALYFFCLIMLSTCSLIAQEQTCNCKRDLSFLIEKLKKTPAFKNDYRGRTQVFQNKVNAILNEASVETSPFNCFRVLAKTLLLVNDRHNTIYGVDSVKSKQDRLTSYPDYEGDLLALRNELKRHAFDTVAGVYYAGSKLQVGVFRESDSSNYKMIILDSELDLWEPGELLGVLIPVGGEGFAAVMGDYSTKTPRMIYSGWGHGEFFSLSLKKDLHHPNNWEPEFEEKTYVHKILNTNFTYIKAQSFSGFYPTLSDAEAFYESLENKLNTPYLIVDLRSNGGGGDRNSDLLFKLLKDYAKNGKIAVLINQNTASNAEQFVIRLQQLDRVSVLGDRSKGVLAYELKGDTFLLPNKIFKVTLTSKRLRKYREYEGFGVKPDSYLDYSKDWIEQAKVYMKTDSRH